MDQNDRDRQPDTDETGFERNMEDQPDREGGGMPASDDDLQKEGNLGNERNRNQPDTEQRPGGNRDT